MKVLSKVLLSVLTFGGVLLAGCSAGGSVGVG